MSPASGAIAQRRGWIDAVRGYFAHHRYVAADSVRRLLMTPAQSLLTWSVVAVAIVLPALLYIVLAQFQSVSQGWGTEPQLSLFINARAREPAILSLQESLAGRADIASVQYLNPAQALAEFKQYSGLGAVIDSLDENPLPPVLIITPIASNGETLANLRDELAADLLVDEARLDLEWIERLQQIVSVGERAIAVITLLLALGVLLIIGNTIRLTIESRRQEIVVIKLVGGTNAFIRRPFLYSGMFYGFGGSVLAWLIITAVVTWLGEPVSRLAELYGSSYKLEGLAFADIAMMFLVSSSLGVLAAHFSVSKYLRAIRKEGY